MANQYKHKYKDTLEHFNALLIKLTNGCHILNVKTRPDGYSQFKHDGKAIFGHIFSYETFKGSTNGLDVHHRCKYKRCVNPEHLELKGRKEHNDEHSNNITTINENKTYCVAGHEYTAANTYYRGKHRSCRICNKVSRDSSNRIQQLLRALTAFNKR